MNTRLEAETVQIDVLGNGFAVIHRFHDNDVVSRLYDKRSQYTGIEMRSQSQYINRTALAAAVVHC